MRSKPQPRQYTPCKLGSSFFKFNPLTHLLDMWLKKSGFSWCCTNFAEISGLLRTKQNSNVLPAHNLDGHQISWRASLSHKVVLCGLVGQYMGISMFHLVALARSVNSYIVKYVSEQTLSSCVLILTLIAMKSGIQAIHT